MNTEIWAQLHLSSQDCIRLRKFLIEDIGVKKKYILRKMHITVYYARRPLIGLKPSTRSTKIIIPASETRFMVMTPGGENPRQEIKASDNLVGIRIHRKCSSREEILKLRNQILMYETKLVLGTRKPSTKIRNAFGSRWFQPHMAMLRSGSNVQEDLTKLGIPFRKKIGDLLYDKFEIKITQRENMKGLYANKTKE